MANNNVTMEVLQLKKNFRKRYNYLSFEEVNDIYQDALDYYLSLAYPLNHSITEIPEERLGDLRYIRILMRNILERAGCTSAVAYSENGLSYTLDGTLFDDKIAKLIIPQGKVI